MKHIVCFSGGKDSTALILWAKENLPEFTAVFCDTGWEHPITYAYVEEINQMQLDGKLVALHSQQYEDLMDCWLDHQMFSNNETRFCTQDMKIAPLHEWLGQFDDEITTYQGIRAEESRKRAQMRDTEMCNVYADNKKLDVAFSYIIKRPLFHQTAEWIFNFALQRGVQPNPLYLRGASRVGCWPCVLANLRDLKAYLVATPDIRERLIDAEAKMQARTGKSDRTFFRAGFIPSRFCSIVKQTAKGKTAYVPTAEDVFRYIESVDEDQLPLLPARSCMSVYNLCE